MRFTFYTDKSVAQCNQALNERLQGGGKLQGRVDKSSAQFTMTTSTKVLKRFARSTRMHGKIVREEGVTTVQGYVSEGIERGRWILFYIVALILTFFFYYIGNALIAFMIFGVATWSYIPLIGDAHNSDSLLREIKRTLDAKETKPKPNAPSSSSSSSAPSTAVARPAAKPSPFGSTRPSTPPSSSASKPPFGNTNPPKK